MLAYLSGPIDAYVDDEQISREEATEALRRQGFTVYDPSRAFQFKGDPLKVAREVHAINEAARRMADAHLALWPDGASSLGTPMEIQDSARERQPVAVCGGQRSVQLEAMDVQRFLYEDVGLAAAWLRECAGQNGRRDTSAVFRFAGGSGGAGTPPRTIRWAGTGRQPKMGLPGDAGFDLYCSQDVVVPFNGFVDIPCDVSIELPPGVWAMITGRSSTIRKRHLLVNTGIIDNGYRGPLYCAVWNMGNRAAKVEAGERLAQLIPFPLTSAGLNWERVAELADSVRGADGFGSTGA